MTEQQRGRRAIEVGPTGKSVAANIARLRERNGLTTRQLAGALERAGRPIPASGITRMEKAERVVTADDLAALAVVFGVSPAALLLPMTASPDDLVEVSGVGSVPAGEAWAWGSTRQPLRSAVDARQPDLLEYQLYGLPIWLRDLWNQIRQLEQMPAMPPRQMAALLDGLLHELGQDKAGGSDG